MLVNIEKQVNFRLLIECRKSLDPSFFTNILLWSLKVPPFSCKIQHSLTPSPPRPLPFPYLLSYLSQPHHVLRGF